MSAGLLVGQHARPSLRQSGLRAPLQLQVDSVLLQRRRQQLDGGVHLHKHTASSVSTLRGLRSSTSSALLSVSPVPSCTHPRHQAHLVTVCILGRGQAHSELLGGSAQALIRVCRPQEAACRHLCLQIPPEGLRFGAADVRLARCQATAHHFLKAVARHTAAC